MPNEEHLLTRVAQALRHLAALRARLENEGTAPGSLEISSALVDLQEVLEKLRAHCSLLREILARTSDAIFAKDRAGRYVMINPKGAAMFGLSVKEILGQDDGALFDRETAEHSLEIDREVMDTGKPHTAENVVQIRGVVTTLITTRTAWYDSRGTLCGVIGSSQNVTERKLAERGAEYEQGRLRSLATEVMVDEECLRQSLAADLQNGLGQDIALAKLKLSALRSSSSADLHDPLSQIESLVEQADRSLRSISFQLSPPSLHDLGLVPAVEWLAEDIGNRYGLEVEIEDEGASAVADWRMRVILFRAVRELLINTATHAGATKAHVRLGSESNRVRIMVEDDGVGFDDAEGDLVGYGLFGIREQLRHVGGSIRIRSARGRGTTVVLTAPQAFAVTSPE